MTKKERQRLAAIIKTQHRSCRKNYEEQDANGDTSASRAVSRLAQSIADQFGFSVKPSFDRAVFIEECGFNEFSHLIGI